jgi:hypothetical protein
VTEPTRRDEPADDPDDERADEDRAISDVGLPHPGDQEKGEDPQNVGEAALDEVFPPAEERP